MKLNGKDIERIGKETEKNKIIAIARCLAKLGDKYSIEYLDDMYEEEWYNSRMQEFGLRGD